MDTRKKLLVIGDNEKAPYHPLAAIEEQLGSILSEQYEVEFVTDYCKLNWDGLKEYPVVISYTDCWEYEPTRDFAVALQTYVINGGSLLVIHSGISLQARYELAQLMGARFTTHPERTNITYTDFNTEHPILKGVQEFTMFEEPYQFEYDPFTQKTVLFNYVYNDKAYTAAWAHHYALGKVVYLSPGHDSSIFENKDYRNIISNSITWLINK